MSSRLPRVSATEVIKVLEMIGFALARQSGSHKIYKNAGGRKVTVPYHGSTILNLKTLKSILNDADLTVKEFIELLKNS
ncbi:MAG: type II toxin-antitoxin system HicA family toxin [Leptolyngbyaceae cyanobacterium RM1_406_9]|nr:type II toxin-antitoxin system HicA family toxin [Leptolyngbyaceae cyanobacterium SM1_4_3]NJO76296.1 type II toxin-antitoxin system HicA family toxin [Leptolyngbyaceae cyanobacterium RM1_406_9]